MRSQQNEYAARGLGSNSIHMESIPISIPIVFTAYVNRNINVNILESYWPWQCQYQFFSQTNNNGNINSNCFETQYQWQWQYQFLFKPISMAIPIAIVVPRQYQWQYQYQLFSSAISMSMAISIVSIALSQYQCSINQYLSKLININGNVNCSKNTLSIVNGNNNTSKIVNTNGCQYYCSCLVQCGIKF